MRFGFRCTRCAKAPADVRRWRCGYDAPFALEDSLPFSREAINTDLSGICRYRAMIPVTEIISLSEGNTPLVEVEPHGHKATCKLEYLAPTGSFKECTGCGLCITIRSLPPARAYPTSTHGG